MVRLTAAFAHALCGILGVEPQPLRCVNVHHHRMVDATHLLEGANQLMHIVAVLHVAVVESEVAEQIALAPAVRVTHRGQRRIHATMVLGNRHLIVVDENDHIAALLGGVVEPLERNRRAEGAVADHRDHIVRLRRAPRSPYHVTFLRHAACQRD